MENSSSRLEVLRGLAAPIYPAGLRGLLSCISPNATVDSTVRTVLIQPDPRRSGRETLVAAKKR